MMRGGGSNDAIRRNSSICCSARALMRPNAMPCWLADATSVGVPRAAAARPPIFAQPACRVSAACIDLLPGALGDLVLQAPHEEVEPELELLVRLALLEVLAHGVQARERLR